MSLTWLVLGANGQVGRQLCRALQPLGSGKALGRSECDLAQPGRVAEAVRQHAPSVIVNAAAFTGVDRAEDEPDLARRVNAEAVDELARACREVGSVLVHYSTDYVFDGRGELPFTLEAPTGPLSVYGRTKLAGEQAVRDSGSRHLVLRTSWVYDNTGHNFVNTMLRLGRERDELNVVDDQIGAPTWAATIADVTSLVLHEWSRCDFDAAREGVYHLCSRGETSWHGLAEAVFSEAEALGLLPRRPRVIPIPSSAYPQKAPRPGNSRLEVSALESAFGLRLPHWRDALTCAIQSR